MDAQEEQYNAGLLGTAILPPIPIEADLAMRAWRLMGSELDWSAVPLLCELLEIEDPLAWVEALAAVRDVLRERR